MMHMMTFRPGFRSTVRMALPVLMLALLTGPAHGADPMADQSRLHQEIAGNIAGHPGLDSAQRERMMGNLQECLDRGMTTEQMHALFPGHGSGGTNHAASMLAMQDRVLALEGRDLPFEPVMGKIMEGRMKNVPHDRLERVVDDMGHGIEVSHRIMMGAIDGGVQGPDSPAGMHGANTELARCLWDGLGEQDMEHLAQRAQDRARDGGCGLDEFVAASQAATRFTHSGMDHDQAVAMAGDAIHHGYSAAEMRSMGDMMVGTAAMDEHHLEMASHMQEWVHDGMSMDDMTQHMMEGGWMGPADMMGPGGSHPMDNIGWGGAGHHGGADDGDHGHGGMGGDGGGMGGDGGGMGGH